MASIVAPVLGNSIFLPVIRAAPRSIGEAEMMRSMAVKNGP